jgi:hypothetical protein
MGRKKKDATAAKTPESAANQPFSLRLRDDVAEALAAFREREASRTGWDAPSKPEIIDRALREFLAKQGIPLSVRPGARD